MCLVFFAKTGLPFFVVSVYPQVYPHSNKMVVNLQPLHPQPKQEENKEDF